MRLHAGDKRRRADGTAVNASGSAGAARARGRTRTAAVNSEDESSGDERQEEERQEDEPIVPPSTEGAEQTVVAERVEGGTAHVPWISTLVNMTYMDVARTLQRLVAYHEYQFRPPRTHADAAAAPNYVSMMLSLPGGVSGADRQALLRGTLPGTHPTASPHAAESPPPPDADGGIAESASARTDRPAHADACVVVRGRRIISAAEALWLYAVLARIDLPLTPELSAAVRQLYVLVAAQLSWLLSARTNDAPPCNHVAALQCLAVVAGVVFRQRLEHETW